MENSQKYIGAPNGIVLCVDHVGDLCLNGRFYHAYSREATDFSCFNDLWFKIEAFFNEIRFPYPGTTERSFFGEKRRSPETCEMKNVSERKRAMNDEELLSKHGDLGTFILRVQHRQNSTWQGRITWVDENKTMQFRSVWELTKLIEEALDTVSEQEE